MNKKWAIAALTRCLRTMAQTCVSTLLVSETIFEVNWKYVLGSSILAGVLCIMMCLGGLPESEDSND